MINAREGNVEEVHLIISSLINYVKTISESQLKGVENIDIEEVNKQIISNIYQFLDKKELITNYSNNNNFNIVNYLYQYNIYSNSKNYDTNTDLHIFSSESLLEDIIKNAFKSTNSKNTNSNFKSYFELYYKYLAYNKNMNFDQIQKVFIDQVTKLLNENYNLDIQLIKAYFSTIVTIMEEVIYNQYN